MINPNSIIPGVTPDHQPQPQAARLAEIEARLPQYGELLGELLLAQHAPADLRYLLDLVAHLKGRVGEESQRAFEAMSALSLEQLRTRELEEEWENAPPCVVEEHATLTADLATANEDIKMLKGELLAKESENNHLRIDLGVCRREDDLAHAVDRQQIETLTADLATARQKAARAEQARAVAQEQVAFWKECAEHARQERDEANNALGNMNELYKNVTYEVATMRQERDEARADTKHVRSRLISAYEELQRETLSIIDTALTAQAAAQERAAKAEAEVARLRDEWNCQKCWCGRRAGCPCSCHQHGEAKEDSK